MRTKKEVTIQDAANMPAFRSENRGFIGFGFAVLYCWSGDMMRCDVRADNTALRSVGRHPHYIFVHVFFLVVPPALLPAAYPARP